MALLCGVPRVAYRFYVWGGPHPVPCSRRTQVAWLLAPDEFWAPCDLESPAHAGNCSGQRGEVTGKVQDHRGGWSVTAMCQEAAEGAGRRASLGLLPLEHCPSPLRPSGCPLQP